MYFKVYFSFTKWHFSRSLLCSKMLAIFELLLLVCITRHTWTVRTTGISPNSFREFNPILHRGANMAPDDRRSSAVSLRIALHSPNFLTLFLSMFYKSQKSCFQKKKIFCKKYQTLSKISIGRPFYAKIKIFKKHFLFFGKYYLFCLNINFIWSQLYFRYIAHL